MEDLQTRKEEAQARIAAAQRVQSARDEERAAVEEVEAMEREAAGAEALLEAQTEHGANRVALVQTELGPVIVKAPHAATFRRFADKGSTKTADFEKLATPCLVFPDRTRFESILDQQPGVLLRVADRVAELAGVRTKETEGK